MASGRPEPGRRHRLVGLGRRSGTLSALGLLRHGGQPVKITKIEAIPFSIPYRKPLRFASGEVTAADHVLVRVHTDDGLIGTAEAPPRPYTYGETQQSIVAVIDTVFAPAVTGLSPLEREQVHHRLARTVGNPTARAAID